MLSLPLEALSFPSRASLSRHAERRSLPGSANPSNVMPFMFLHDFVGLQSSSIVSLALP